MNPIVDWVTPYQFSWLAVTVYPLAGVVYGLGMRSVGRAGIATRFWRPLAFYLGLALCYSVMHTRLDYYGQFLFFAHRAQHLVLHHVGAILIALGNPAKFWPIGVRPLVDRAKQRFGPVRVASVTRTLMLPVRLLQHPLIGSFTFVGLIYFWLWPAVHFDAMLSHDLYLIMNWSMVIDGLLFWMVIVDPRPIASSPMPGYPTRFMMIIGTTIPQIVLGAYITFSSHNLYKVYAVCGRAWPIAAKTDQLYGGLLTWIPPAMMELIGALIVLSMLIARDQRAMVSNQSPVNEKGA